MSNAEEYPDELVVDDELLAELSRRGVTTTSLHVGDVMQFRVVHHEQGSDVVRDFGSFAGGMNAGPDYAARTDEVLAEGFGRS